MLLITPKAKQKHSTLLPHTTIDFNLWSTKLRCSESLI